jgi:hypothetical protein
MPLQEQYVLLILFWYALSRWARTNFLKKSDKQRAYSDFIDHHERLAGVANRDEFQLSEDLRDILDELHIIQFVLHRQRDAVNKYHEALLRRNSPSDFQSTKQKIDDYIFRIECLREEAVRTNTSVSQTRNQ